MDESLPRLGHHQAIQLGGDDRGLAVNDLDHGLDTLCDSGSKKIADLH
jgi:hypothetical protein